MDDGGDGAWAEVRRAYEGKELRLAEICRAFGVTAREIAARRKREGWKVRALGWRPGRPQFRGKDEVPSGAACQVVAAKAASGQGEAATGFPRGEPMVSSPADRSKLIQRMFRAIDVELTIIEERMADKDNRSPADSERDTRSIGALIKNLEKLTEFDGQIAEGDGRDRAGGKAGGVAGITADDADRIRRDLAARIERLNKGEGA